MEGIVSDMVYEISWDDPILFNWLSLQWKIHPTVGFVKKLFTQPFIPQTTGLVPNYITSFWYQSWVPIMSTSRAVHEFSVLAEIAE